jgi:hypothetical protein
VHSFRATAGYYVTAFHLAAMDHVIKKRLALKQDAMQI